MNFDIIDFIKNVPEGISRQELGTKVYEEIRAAENLKVGYLDQAFENPEFYVSLTRQLDNYIYYLKLLHNKLLPEPIALDQELYTAEQPELDQITALATRMEESERNRYSED